MHIPEREPRAAIWEPSGIPLSILLVVLRQNDVVLYAVATSLIRLDDR